MQRTLEILSVVTRSGNKNGKDWKLQEAQCILRGGDQLLVGQMILNAKKFPDVKPGHYQAFFDLQVTMDGKIAAQVVELKHLAHVTAKAA